MATKTSAFYKDNRLMAAASPERVRRLDAYIDFTVTANQTAAAGDDLKLFSLPVGSVILAAGIQQITAGSAGNTYLARVGTVNMSSTLASDAVAGVVTTAATYALDGNAGTLTIPPYVLATAADFNLLSASAVRATGNVRAFLIYLEGVPPVATPTLAQRDQSL